MPISVEYLLRNPFSSQSLSNKFKILDEGKPRPQLPHLRIHLSADGTDERFVCFQTSEYERYEWLTGCEKRQALFCWICLLFGPSSVWNTQGVRGVLLRSMLLSHQRSNDHLQAMIAMQQYLRSNSKVLRFDSVLYNKLVKRNQIIVNRIIDSVIFVVLQKQLQRNKSKVFHHRLKSECLEAMNFLSEKGVSEEEDNMFEDATFLLKNNSKIVNLIVESLGQVLKRAINREASAAAFVSIIQSGHDCYSTDRGQQSVVFRYLKNGKICERFVGYYYNQFLPNLTNVVIEYHLSQRVLSVSVDGTFPSQVLNIIHSEVSSMYPYACFMPCYFHKFWDVVTETLARNGLKHFDELPLFFKMMHSMVTFFQKHRADVEAFLKGRVSETVSFHSANDPATLNWIKTHRKVILDFLTDAIENCDEWETDDCIKIFAFEEFLSRFSTVYWLAFFIKLFHLTKDIHELLDGPTPEEVFASDLVNKVVSDLVTKRDTGFGDFWNDIILNDYLGTEMSDQLKNLSKHQCVNTYCVALSYVIFLITKRLNHLNTFRFFYLVNPLLCSSTTASERRHLVSLVIQTYGCSFQEEALYREVEELCNNKHYSGLCSAEQLLAYLTRYESRRRNFPNLVKLTELVLTMPCTRPQDGHTSVIDRIEAFSPVFSEHSIDFSFLCIERELLEEHRLKEYFYGEVRSTLKMEMLCFKT